MDSLNNRLRRMQIDLLTITTQTGPNVAHDYGFAKLVIGAT